MNTDTMQLVYGFASAALLLGTCALISEYGLRSDVSEKKKMLAAICLPTLLWAVILAGAKWLFG